MGQTFPKIIFGTAAKSSSPDVQLALTLGYPGLDTGGNLSHNEDKDGRSLTQFLAENHKVHRNALIIQSKYSPEEFFSNSPECPYKFLDSLELQVLKSFHNSMSKLNVDHLDVYFLHRPLKHLEQTLRVWSTMEKIAAKGGIVKLGISQVDLQTLELLFENSLVKPAVVQNRFNPQNTFDIDVMQYCARKGISYQAYGIFSDENRRFLQLRSVLRHAEEAHISPHCALLSLIMALGDSLGLNISFIDGTRNKLHMEQNLYTVYNENHPTQQVVMDFKESLR
ncbi:MAG: hypothetical protein Q9164_006767 [Protoblastenia rupestris]